MTKEQLIYLKSEIEERIKSFAERRNFYRNKALYISVGVAGFAALASVLLGLNIKEWTEQTRIASLIITSLIAVVNSYNAFLSPKELWVANNNALNHFYELKNDIIFYEKGVTDPDEKVVLEFKNRYQAILDEVNQSWQKARMDTHKS